MKRINPTTGNFFIRGDVRQDGFIFQNYNLKRIKKNGTFWERWLSPKSFETNIQSTLKSRQKRSKIIAEKSLLWYHKNKDRILEKKKQYYIENKESINKKQLLYKSKNPDKIKELSRRTQIAFAAKINAKNRARKAAKKCRTPAWSTEIDFERMENEYRLAGLLTKITGTSWEVDHIIPLQGKLVSGLHVPSNLRAIPAFANRSKHNRYEITK